MFPLAPRLTVSPWMLAFAVGTHFNTLRRFTIQHPTSWQRFNARSWSHPTKRKEYESVEGACSWSRSLNLNSHNEVFRHLSGGFPKTWATLDDGRADFAGNSDDPALQHLQDHLEVQTCEKKIQRGNADVLLWQITRVRPILLPSTLTFEMVILPAAPTSEAYLVQSLDALTDLHGYVEFPPVHPHHSQTIPIGMDVSRQNATFKNFRALPNMLHEPIAPITAYSFFPGFLPDMICEDEVDSMACLYLATPDGSGIHKPTGAEFWTHTRINDVRDPKDDRLLNLTLTYARLWLLPQRWKHPLKITVLYFSISHFEVKPFLIPANRGTTIAWKVWRFPCPITFLGSFLHTHADVGSRVMVLRTNISHSLPGKQGYAIPHNGSSTLQRRIMTRFQPLVLCIFKSRSARGAWRDDNNTSSDLLNSCDACRFQQDESMTMVAFFQPSLVDVPMHSKLMVMAHLALVNTPIPSV